MRISSAVLSAAAIVWGAGFLAIAGYDAWATDTAGLPAPASAPSAEETRKDADARWQEINDAVRNVKMMIDKKQFQGIPAEAEKIRAGVRWLDEHPGSMDDAGKAGFSGLRAHIKEFSDMLEQESVKGNEMTVKLCYRKISDYVQSAAAIYSAPPVAQAKPKAAVKSAPAVEPAASPEKPAAQKAMPSTPPKSEITADTSAKPAPKPASPGDTVTKAPAKSAKPPASTAPQPPAKKQ